MICFAQWRDVQHTCTEQSNSASAADSSSTHSTILIRAISNHVGSRGPGSERTLPSKPLRFNRNFLDLLIDLHLRRVSSLTWKILYLFGWPQVYMAKLAEQAERYDEMVRLPVSGRAYDVQLDLRSEMLRECSLASTHRTLLALAIAPEGKF